MAQPPPVQGVQEFKALKRRCVSYLDRANDALGISRVGQISLPIIKKLNKDSLAQLLSAALCNLDELAKLTTDFESTTKCMKNEFHESQQKIVKLQTELLASKDEQLNSLKSAVKSSVEDSVKSELKSYSSVVQSSCPQESIINPVELKKVVQTVVDQEDRSKNLMLFGLPEERGEQLDVAVGELFSAIEEKPRFEACRIGNKVSDTISRPVKVSVSSTMVVTQILYKARRLKLNEKYKSVFILSIQTGQLSRDCSRESSLEN